jgi:hypothetical protein
MDMACFKQVLGTATALHASGMDWLTLAETVKGLAVDMDWPYDAKGWDDCLKEVIEADQCSDAVLLSLLPLAGLNRDLPWPAVFRAMGHGWSGAEERYTFLQRLLDGYNNGFWSAGFMDVCVANLSRAGIHPASLILAGYPKLDVLPFEDLLTRTWGRPGLEPLGWWGEDWRLGISEWELRSEAMDCMDGIHTTHRTTLVRGCQGSYLDAPRAVLGNRMVFGHDLEIGGMQRLKSIGSDVTVFGDLFLKGLAGLERLGERIRVEGDLSIQDCPALEGLPVDLYVGGEVDIPAPRPGFVWGAGIDTFRMATPGGLGTQVDFPVPAALLNLQGD